MASVKLGTLIIRTIAKPISTMLKDQAKQHEKFRGVCVRVAQTMHRGEMTLRTRLLGEPVKATRPLSETKAIENGANALAEGFLFAVAASLVIAETWRSSRSSTKRREAIDDAVDSLDARLSLLSDRVEEVAAALDARWALEHARNDELVRVLERVLALDMAGGGARTPDGERLLESVRLPPVVPPELRVGSGRPVTDGGDALAASDTDAPARAGEDAASHSS